MKLLLFPPLFILPPLSSPLQLLLISRSHFKVMETNSTALLFLLLLFSLHQGQKLLVENSDTYTLTAVSRAGTGEYKCSLVDNEEMEDSQSIVVNCEYW